MSETTLQTRTANLHQQLDEFLALSRSLGDEEWRKNIQRVIDGIRDTLDNAKFATDPHLDHARWVMECEDAFWFVRRDVLAQEEHENANPVNTVSSPGAPPLLAQWLLSAIPIKNRKRVETHLLQEFDLWTGRYPTKFAQSLYWIRVLHEGLKLIEWKKWLFAWILKHIV